MAYHPGVGVDNLAVGSPHIFNCPENTTVIDK